MNFVTLFFYSSAHFTPCVLKLKYLQCKQCRLSVGYLHHHFFKKLLLLRRALLLFLCRRLNRSYFI